MTKVAIDLTPQQRESRPMVVSIVAGIVVFLLLGSVGLVFSLNVATQWAARSSVLVLPSKPVNPDQVPAYYETLSRGQMVSTLAELVRLGEFQTEVADQFGFSESQRASVELTVNVVADTAMLQVVATSEDPRLAATMVDGVVEASTGYIGDLVLPYALVPVSKGADNLTEFGLSAPLVFAVFFLVAMIFGLAVQQATFRLTKLAEQRRLRRAEDAGEGGNSVVGGTAEDDTRSGSTAPGLVGDP